MKLPWYLKQVDKPYEDEEGWHIEVKFTWFGWWWFRWKKLRAGPHAILEIDITTEDGKKEISGAQKSPESTDQEA